MESDCLSPEPPPMPPPAGRPRPRRMNHPRSKGEEEGTENCIDLPFETRQSQEWLNARLADVLPADFIDGLALFYTFPPLEAPPEFRDVFRCLHDRHWAGGSPTKDERQAIRDASAILVFADVLDKYQLEKVINMTSFVNNNFGEDAPVVMLVLHTVHPEVRVPTDEDDEFQAVAHAMDSGVDEVILGEPEGLRFTWEVRNRVTIQTCLLHSLWEQAGPVDQLEMEEKTEALEEAVHDIVWEYARVRLGTHIPSVDRTLPVGVPKHIQNFRVGSLLGSGTYGNVHRLIGHDGKASGFVLKAVCKNRITDIEALVRTKKQLQVMRALSDEAPHRNIVKMHSVLHSRSHLLYRIDDAGNFDLYRYLQASEKMPSLMTIDKAETILSQHIAAVYHMHANVKVVHLDLKPENIIVSDTEAGVNIRVADFDTSELNPTIPMHGVVGTFPFSAPEVLLKKEYDPYAVDIWSSALIILEVLCRRKILESSLHLDSGENAPNSAIKCALRKQSISKVFQYFSDPKAVGYLLGENVRLGLESLVTHSFLMLLQGMFRVEPSARVQVGHAVKALEMSRLLRRIDVDEHAREEIGKNPVRHLCG